MLFASAYKTYTMRSLTFVFLFAPVALQAQYVELIGKYSASFLGAENIEFKKNDSFYFNGFYCTNGVHGKGVCAIKGNYLYLYFEKSKTNLASPAVPSPVIHKSDTATEASRVQIQAVDKNGIPIEFMTVEIKSLVSKKVNITSADGKAWFNLQKQDYPIAIQTAAVGYQPGSVKLESASNYEIKIFHDFIEFDEALINGEIFVYEIGDISEDVIEMRPKNSSEKFRKYRRRE